MVTYHAVCNAYVTYAHAYLVCNLQREVARSGVGRERQAHILHLLPVSGTLPRDREALLPHVAVSRKVERQPLLDGRVEGVDGEPTHLALQERPHLEDGRGAVRVRGEATYHLLVGKW